MPQLPQQWNNSAAQASLAPVASSPEYVIPLWWYSGDTTGNTTVSPAVAGVGLVQKGTTLLSLTPTPTAVKLHTLNPAWPATTKFAFEVTLRITATSDTAYAELYDFTSPSGVSASQVSTTSFSSVVLRSSQITLKPGHVYGVTIWAGNSANYAKITDASLIVFPS